VGQRILKTEAAGSSRPVVAIPYIRLPDTTFPKSVNCWQFGKNNNKRNCKQLQMQKQRDDIQEDEKQMM
jgi:hypothetical protein